MLKNMFEFLQWLDKMGRGFVVLFLWSNIFRNATTLS
jgi:hypothetical protein